MSIPTPEVQDIRRVSLGENERLHVRVTGGFSREELERVGDVVQRWLGVERERILITGPEVELAAIEPPDA